jgi:calcium/proton exchanger cax
MTDHEAGTAQDEAVPDRLELTATVAVILLLLITTMIAFHAEFLVRSVGSFTVNAHMSDRFVGLILVPIIGNAAEHMTAVIMAFRGKLDLAIGIALGSGVQVAALLLPVMVLVGWMMGVTSMTLVLDDLQCYILLVSLLVLIPTLLTADIRKSNDDLRADDELRTIRSLLRYTTPVFIRRYYYYCILLHLIGFSFDRQVSFASRIQETPDR